MATTYDCYRPSKPRNMTPVEYYRLHKCVPEDYTGKCRGRYWCNPAHCSKSWKDKASRDRHLDTAYAMLG